MEWICAQMHPLYYGDRLIKPCLSICENVEERCPHFVPDPDDGSGEPSFLCGPAIPEGICLQN